ncbi:MAG: acyltransferase [Acidobacteriota bacterium]
MSSLVLELPQLFVGHLVEVLRARRLRTILLKQNSGLSLGKRVEIRSPDRLRLGKDVMIDSGVLLHCGGMEWSGGEGGILIGDATYVGPNSVLFGAGGIEIGGSVLISPGVVITSHQHTFAQRDLPIRLQPSEFAPVLIEDNVWIGSNATILPGVRIEKGSVIGAGAVVTHNVPAGSLYVGVPARFLREL